MRFSALRFAEFVPPGRLQEPATRIARTIDRIVSAPDDESRAQRISLLAYAIRIGSAAIAFLSQVLLARLMGTFEYGVFALVWVTMVITGNLTCLGLHTVVIRFLPQYRAAGDWEHLRGLLVSSRVFALMSASVALGIALLLISFFGQYVDSPYLAAFAIGVFAMPMIALGDVLDGTARSQGWVMRALTPTYIIRPLLLLAFMMIAWQWGHSLSATTALACAVIAAYVTSVSQLLVVGRHVERSVPAGPRRMMMRTWLAVGLPVFLVEGFFFILINADVLMVGMMMQPDDVAVYFATVKTLALVHFVYFAVKAGVAHQFAAQIDNPDKQRLGSLARKCVLWTFWPSLAMGGFLLAAGPFLLALFGAEFTHGYPLLFILVAGVVFRSSVGPAESLLNMSGHQNACAAVFGSALAVNLMLNAIFIPIFGLAGAAIATACATVFETLALHQLVARRFGFSMSILAHLNARKS